jgi:hypothetical protein
MDAATGAGMRVAKKGEAKTWNLLVLSLSMGCVPLGVIKEPRLGLAQRVTARGETWGTPGGRRFHALHTHPNQ